jgi:hypothetical protein
MMIVPDGEHAAGAWQTEILAPEICPGAVPRIWRTLPAMRTCRNAFRRGRAIGVKQQSATCGGVHSASRLRPAAQAQIFEAVDRLIR